MKNIILKLTLLLTGFIFITGCLDQDRVDFGKGPTVVQFAKATETKSFVQKGTGELTDYNVVIQSFGGDNMPTTEPITVTVAVAASSEAKDGVEVTIPTKTVTIPAGANSANLLVKVNADKLTVGTPKQLVLEIVSSSQTVSNGKEKMSIKLQAICESNLAGTYVYTTGTKREVTVKATTTGNYTVSGDNAFSSAYSFNFSDNCGNLTVTGGYLTDNFGIPVSGTGTVDKTTGNITINYTAEGYFTARPMTLQKK
ncbi:hypothetical protein EGI11_10880 [Chryseobacterium sp. H3056]|uniref:DUF4843 domain-containing protein n=1 Tax=Kaistella daneshvariae TaxID=2487074 RepID=A0A3N0WT60_9FLAO|nr:hypothetical protein [Kaistella daneshvariae]ROI08143.1 hypothetical protein EGI11_10880 [Kaistella daneshvariae]